MKQYCIPPTQNGAFVANMEDVLLQYTQPYDETQPVVCMDELSKQLVSETRASLPMSPGKVTRTDFEYERQGTCNLFMFVEPLTGIRHVRVTQQRTKQDWAGAIRELVDDWYPTAEQIVLVLDNLNTHVASSLYEAFPPAEARRLLAKLEFHYTPKHGSWLNMAEIELSVLHRQCLNRRIATMTEVTTEVAAWEQRRNTQLKVIKWRFTTPDARIKLKRLYPVIEP